MTSGRELVIGLFRLVNPALASYVLTVGTDDIISPVGSADNSPRRFYVIRFRIKELLEECNRALPDDEEHWHMQLLADEIGISRSTLAGLTTLTREPVTNTATIEALCRFFHMNHPRFRVQMLFEFAPSLDQTTTTQVDELYPRRAEKGRQYRRRR